MIFLVLNFLSSLSERLLFLYSSYLFGFFLFFSKFFLVFDNLSSVGSSKRIKLRLAIVWCVASLSENALDPFEEATNKSCFVVFIQIFE